MGYRGFLRGFPSLIIQFYQWPSRWLGQLRCCQLWHFVLGQLKLYQAKRSQSSCRMHVKQSRHKVWRVFWSAQPLWFVGEGVWQVPGARVPGMVYVHPALHKQACSRKIVPSKMPKAFKEFWETLRRKSNAILLLQISVAEIWHFFFLRGGEEHFFNTEQ